MSFSIVFKAQYLYKVPLDKKDGWIDVVLSVDQKKKKIALRVDEGGNVGWISHVIEYEGELVDYTNCLLWIGACNALKSCPQEHRWYFTGKLQKMDIGKVTFFKDGKEQVRYTHNLVGWGLGVDANILAEKMRFLGPMRYDIGSLMSIIRGKVRKAKCYVDGNLIDSSFILLLIQNTKTGGDRLTLAPMAHVDDGKMDLGVIYHISRFQVLKLFNQLKASGSHVWNPNVEYYRFKNLIIETDDPTAINVDGENLGTTPLEINVLPSALKVFH